MEPTIGRIVIYNTTPEEQSQMQMHQDNKQPMNIQKQLPAIIVSVFEATVNLQVFFDGVGFMWKTSVPKGDAQGCWNFPVINKLPSNIG